MKTRVRFSKQILSILLCIAMLMSYVPQAVHAAEATTLTGTSYTTNPGGDYTMVAYGTCRTCDKDIYVDSNIAKS